jgi:hypothetical protein
VSVRVLDVIITDVIFGPAPEVACALGVVDASGVRRDLDARVEMPDDARSMLEGVSWRGGATIVELLGRVATICAGRAHGALAAGLVGPLRLQATTADVRAALGA